MIFYLGTHKPHWLRLLDVPLFVSRRTLANYVTLPRAAGEWALDSGGFTELRDYGEWRTSREQYVGEVRRFRTEVGGLRWVAPRDHMCEPFILARTGRTVLEHQRSTVDDFLAIRQELGTLVIPVVQGFTFDDYLRCVEMYSRAGVDLADEPLVGLGSVCRRQGLDEVTTIVGRLAGDGLSLHGFGVKALGLQRYGHLLSSADSLAWSFHARRRPAMPGHKHRNCANCLPYALAWRERLVPA